MAIDQIRVRGAREHNLKNISIDIPRDCLVVITGLSGSGKSSLAFETLYQEGQRRFMESLSSYARQFLGQMSKPQVDSVEGLSPTVCIDQKTVNRNPRSTVGTITEILDHFRLLMARLGEPHCPICHRALQSRNASQISDNLLERYQGKRMTLMAPIVIDRKGEYRAELDEARRLGFVRARIDGEMRFLEEDIRLARYEKHTIELVLDRLKATQAKRDRIVEAIESAILRTEGSISVLVDEERHLISAVRSCPVHGISAPELEPRLFSFNAPQGMCPECNGLGCHEGFSAESLFDPNAKVIDAFKPFGKDDRLPYSSIDKELFGHLCQEMGIDPQKKWRLLTHIESDKLLYGDPSIEYKTVSETAGRRRESVRIWQGFMYLVESIWKYTKLKRLRPYRHRVECTACNGQRLNPLSLAVWFREKNIAQLSNMSIAEACEFFTHLKLNEKEKQIGSQIIKEIRSRLLFLNQVGLSYLSIDRSATTLSGGEAQRIRLAAQVGSGLQGVTYVLDEPSIGLHHRDQDRLLKALQALRDKGNTVIVVEHDPLTMSKADHLIEIGPGAGIEGGRIMAEGPPDRFLKSEALTAQYLRGERGLKWPKNRRPPAKKFISLTGCIANNLKSVHAVFPLERLIAVTGVSGSGKSSLVSETLSKALSRELNSSEDIPGKHQSLEGVDWIDKLVVIDQSPIGRNPRSNPATYTGIMTPIRELMGQTLEARRRGYAIGRFSFNVAPQRGGGRCEECEGAGVKTIEMQMLADVYVTCEACNGKRFNPETLDIRYKGKNIADILAMTISEATEFFANIPKITQTLKTLMGVGMGYVRLGQPSTTLSGGEAQRIKLACHLSKKATGKTLFILDEPTTGLHMADVENLVGALQELVDRGNSVIVIEHDVDVIKMADHIIDLGPEGGVHGGQIVHSGSPEYISKQDTPTGRMLRSAQNDTILQSPSKRKNKPRRSQEKLPICISGAETHNLRHVSVEIPQGEMTVITGPSGSGKSSLAFHTLFAEGQRRYVESLSTYARRFLGRLQRPPVENISGLAPAIAIDQRNRGASPRSTVATATEIHDTLRLLYARIGKAHCPICNIQLEATSPTMAALQLMGGPSVAGRLLSEMSVEISAGELLHAGFSRIWVDGVENYLENPDEVLKQPIVVVDRFNPCKASRERVAEAFSNAYDLGSGMARFVYRNGQEVVLTRDSRCPTHGHVLPEELSPRHFSFNTKLGACEQCGGLGTAMDLDMKKLFPSPDNSLWQGCHGLVKASFGRSAKQVAVTKALFEHYQTPYETAINDWSPALRHAILFGCEREFDIEYRKWGNTYAQKSTWIGLRGMIDNWKSDATWLRTEGICVACDGKRLRPEILSVRIDGLNIAEACEMTIDDARDFWESLMLKPEHAEIALQPIIEICSRIRFLSDVGVGYLTLDRSARTLSGGESQRIRLASQLGSRLTRAVYVLDEPTIGLHHRDTHRLLDTLKGLRALNNTVVIVEHDPDVIAEADHLIDMGPAAGEYGGKVVASGSPKEIATGDSLTGRYLSGRLQIVSPAKRRKPKNRIRITKGSRNNLKDVSVGIGRGILTVVTGVSGSGKSSLVMGEFSDKLKSIIEKKQKDNIQKCVVVNQRPISKSPRSTPVSYCQLLDPIRDIFAKTTESKRRGWTKTRYSYNTKEGRCPICEGRGATLIEMHFLSDVWIQCDACEGARYDEPTLEVRWKGRNIADVLNMSVNDAFDFFQSHRKIRTKLKALKDVGLGYLKLGQPTSQLSGGEAQRLKLAKELAQGFRFVETCFLLDEPTTGLHYSDVAHLMKSIDALVEAGHTVVIIEHNLDVLWCADEIIDLGPEGGDKGGRILAQTTPEKLASLKTFKQNHTAIALKNRENRPF